MAWAWRIGMMVLAGVPAIVGGGLFYAAFEKWTAVVIWEIILLFLLALLISKGDKQQAPHH
jgi:hypothetical protein